MRKSVKAVGTVLLTIGILTGTTVSTTAAPDAPPADSIDYTATPTRESVSITTASGDMAAENGIFTIRDGNGTPLAGIELTFRVDDYVFPIVTEISSRTATLTPLFTLEHATYQPIALPYEDQATWRNEYEREVAAFTRLKDTIATGATLGAVVGGLGGAAIGCILGGVAAAAVVTAAIIGLFGGIIPAAGLGCIAGILAIGSLGTLAGQLVITAPVAIMAAVQYFTTINSPMPNKPAR